VPAKIRKKINNFKKDGPPSSMVLLVFLESEKKRRKKLPNWEICLTGEDIIWGARWCGFYLGRLAVTVARRL